MRGTAQNGIDYTLSGIVGRVTIAAGQNSATVVLHALARGRLRSKTAVMALHSGSGYNLSLISKATVTITN
jgi:hypothetical protein